MKSLAQSQYLSYKMTLWKINSIKYSEMHLGMHQWKMKKVVKTEYIYNRRLCQMTIQLEYSPDKVIVERITIHL